VKGLSIPWGIREKGLPIIKYQDLDIMSLEMTKFMRRLPSGISRKTQMAIMRDQ